MKNIVEVINEAKGNRWSFFDENEGKPIGGATFPDRDYMIINTDNWHISFIDWAKWDAYGIFDKNLSDTIKNLDLGEGYTNENDVIIRLK